MSSNARNGNLLKDTTINAETELLNSTSKTDNDERSIKKNSPCFRKPHFLSIQAFVAFAGLTMCAQMALGIYGKSVLTSVEKRFGISSSVAGFIAGSFNIGNLIFVVAVSKLSSTGHRPRIMAVGSLIIALGGLVNFTPHLINKPYKPTGNNSILLAEEENPEQIYPHLYVVLIVGEILQVHVDTLRSSEYNQFQSSKNGLTGIGATVLIPLSSSYIDDFASENNSPFYLGILFLLQNVGPGFGYLIGSWTSSYYVDFDRISAENISVSSDNKDLWIGAWWLGYIIIPVWVIITTLPLCFFPKALTKSRSETDKQLLSSVDSSSIQSSKIPRSNKSALEKFLDFCIDFGQTVKRLLANFSYMSVVFGYSGLMFVVGSLTAFMPKFLEVSFNKSSGSANLTFGLAVPPTTCFGLLFGGYVVKRFRWKKCGILRFIIISGLLSLLPLFATFFIKCNDVVDKICGQNISNQEGLNKSDLTLNATSMQEMQSCRETACQNASLFFVVLTAICAMLSANMVTPVYTVLLRSVDTADKCTAIGLMFLIIRGLGLIPAPIVSGAVIDETCVIWNLENGERKNCLHYNQEQFRVRYLLLNFFAILFAIVFFLMAYIRLRVVKWRNQDERPPRKLVSTLSKCLNKSQVDLPDKVESTATSV